MGNDTEKVLKLIFNKIPINLSFISIKTNNKKQLMQPAEAFINKIHNLHK